MTVRDSGGNVAVDFVWGNFPMQPNDDRQNNLDPALDNHVIAATQYNGFPGYNPQSPFLDTIVNVTVPNVVGMTLNTANSTLVAAGLSQTSTTTAVGATALNDGTVKTQTPAAAALVNTGTNVALVVYAYVA
jgi:hypothetical protein